MLERHIYSHDPKATVDAFNLVPRMAKVEMHIQTLGPVC